MRVLIVSAGGADLSLVEFRLTERGHTLVHATRDAEALAAARAGGCPLVLVDARGPEARAPLVRALRAAEGGTEAVVVLLGHRGALASLRPVLDAGADDLWVWPGDAEELAERMVLAERRCLRRRERAGVPSGDALGDMLLRVSPVPTSLTTLEDGRVVAANDAYFRAFGYQKEEVLGRTTVELNLWERPIDRAQVVELLRRQGSVRGVDAQYRTRSGELRHTLLFMGLLNYAGTPHLLSLFPDITPLKRAEETARRSEANFRALIENLPDLVCVVGMDGRIRYVNPMSVTALGYADARELLGEPTTALMAAEELPQALERARRMTDQGEEVPTVERRLQRRDGSILHAEVTSFRLPFDGEDTIVSVAHDLTESYQMKARLLQADRMASVGTLAAGVAHEINNPLAYLTANVGFAREELGALLERGPEAEREPWRETVRDAQEALIEALQGAERVRTIVRDLKTFSRVDGTEAHLVDVRQVLDSTLNLAATEIRHRARLVKDYGDSPPVRANESRLGQVFLNLLVNATQAIPEGAPERNEIRVAARAGADGRVVVEISDTGVGIRPEHLTRLFDPFFTTKPPGVGTGLGLSICHNLVTALGGEIRVESNPGQGSTFRVMLPPSTSDEARRAPQPGRSAAPGGRRGRLLVVDDEPLLCAALGRTLRPAHDVTVETRAEEALARIDGGERYDLVLCDLMMPEMSGMDFHAALAQRHPEQAGRMVFLTGGAVTPQARAFLEAVPNAHLEKPFDSERLLAMVRERLAR